MRTDHTKELNMDKNNILGNEEAMAILRDAAARLQAIGVHCMISPMSLPQGMSVSMHVGETNTISVAADVAAGCGGEFAHAVGTEKQFLQMVEYAILDAETFEVEGVVCIDPGPCNRRHSETLMIDWKAAEPAALPPCFNLKQLDMK